MITFDFSNASNVFWVSLVLLWNLPWKGVALWKAARRKEIFWFVLIFVIQTMAILEMFYLFWVIKENKRNYKKVRKWWKRKNGSH